MPKAPVPERFHDLLKICALGHLASVDSNNRPQVNPVWFIWDGDRILLSMKAETQKLRNLRANPYMAISVSDPGNPTRYLEVRGKVVDFELFENLSWVNQLARKYTGADYAFGSDGEQRFKVSVEIESWTAQG